MNKNFKIFQIHGLSGLLLIGFALTGLFCGFVLFPVWAVMIAWNNIVFSIYHGPSINYIQASMLWAIVIICVYLTLKNSISVKIHTVSKEMDDTEINEFANNIEETEQNEKISQGDQK